MIVGRRFCRPGTHSVGKRTVPLDNSLSDVPPPCLVRVRVGSGVTRVRVRVSRVDIRVKVRVRVRFMV